MLTLALNVSGQFHAEAAVPFAEGRVGFIPSMDILKEGTICRHFFYNKTNEMH